MSDSESVTGGDRHGDGSTESGGPRRSVNAAVVAGAVVLIGLVAYGVYRRGASSGTPPPATEQGTEAAAGEPAGGEGAAPVEGTAITASLPVRLSPEAAVAAERYRCICGCNDALSVCTCTRTPGSIDMKAHLQTLVDQKLSPGEVDRGMVEKYGNPVLLSNPAPRPEPSPAGRKGAARP